MYDGLRLLALGLLNLLVQVGLLLVLLGRFLLGLRRTCTGQSNAKEKESAVLRRHAAGQEFRTQPKTQDRGTLTSFFCSCSSCFFFSSSSRSLATFLNWT